MYTSLSSRVIHGKALGRTIWFPTLNCPISSQELLLPAWTYRRNVLIHEQIFRGIGPWFPDKDLCEIHLLDTEGDFYDQEVLFIPLAYIRENKWFASLELLQEQLQKDRQRAQEHPQKVITFGTFDYLHPWHRHYLMEAKQYGDYLITILARDSTVKKVKWSFPDHNEEQRLLALTEWWICDIIDLWDEHDYYTCLHTYLPQVIYLGYDQHSFDEKLRGWCNTHGLETATLIRWTSFAPEKWKSSLIKQQTLDCSL